MLSKEFKVCWRAREGEAQRAMRAVVVDGGQRGSQGDLEILGGPI